MWRCLAAGGALCLVTGCELPAGWGDLDGPSPVSVRRDPNAAAERLARLAGRSPEEVKTRYLALTPEAEKMEVEPPAVEPDLPVAQVASGGGSGERQQLVLPPPREEVAAERAPQAVPARSSASALPQTTMAAVNQAAKKAEALTGAGAGSDPGAPTFLPAAGDAETVAKVDEKPPQETAASSSAASEPSAPVTPPAVMRAGDVSTIPYAIPVKGRPGLVNSPFAAPHQLVDVTGMKVGDMVKCPFSGKLLRVPPPQQAMSKVPATEGASPAAATEASVGGTGEPKAVR